MKIFKSFFFSILITVSVTSRYLYLLAWFLNYACELTINNETYVFRKSNTRTKDLPIFRERKFYSIVRTVMLGIDSINKDN